MIYLLGFLVVIATFWMMVIAIKSDQIGWAVGIFFIPLIFVPLYGLLNWNTAKNPFLVAVGSMVLAVLAVANGAAV